MFDSLLQDPSLLVLGALVLAAVSGVPGLLLRPGESGQKLAGLCAVAASALALPALASLLVTGKTVRYLLNWGLPFGPCELSFDPLSLFFLIPIFLVFPAGTLYALGYWPNATRRSSEPVLTFFYGLLCVAMALVVLARSGPLLLIAWEVMALSGFFLLLAEHEELEVRRAAMV